MQPRKYLLWITRPSLIRRDNSPPSAGRILLTRSLPYLHLRRAGRCSLVPPRQHSKKYNRSRPEALASNEGHRLVRNLHLRPRIIHTIGLCSPSWRPITTITTTTQIRPIPLPTQTPTTTTTFATTPHYLPSRTTHHRHLFRLTYPASPQPRPHHDTIMTLTTIIMRFH